MYVPSTATPSGLLRPVTRLVFTPVPSRFALPIVSKRMFVQLIPLACAEDVTHNINNSATIRVFATGWRLRRRNRSGNALTAKSEGTGSETDNTRARRNERIDFLTSD